VAALRANQNDELILPRRLLHPSPTVLGEGRAYRGANQYVMHFPKGELPPAEGFWSLTMYDSVFSCEQSDQLLLDQRAAESESQANCAGARLPMMAHMRSADRVRKCLLFGVDLTYRRQS
jgi:hypothetical protein